MRMKAQLENLFCRPKVWLQFWKLGCSLGGRKQWTFLFIERWKNKYAKKCLFLTGSKTPSYFCLFSLRAWEHSTNVNRRCFIVPCVVLEVSDHGQQVLAHLPAMQRTMRPLSAHVLWHGGDGNWMFALHSQGCGGEAWAPDERERERDLSSWRDRCARWLAEASPSDYRRGTLCLQIGRGPAFPCSCCLVTSVVSDSLWPHGLQPAKLLCPWDFLGKNTGGGCHFLLQGIFLT